MPTKFQPTEIAYRLPGRGWVRTVKKTERAFDAFIAKLQEKGAEILTREVEGS